MMYLVPDVVPGMLFLTYVTPASYLCCGLPRVVDAAIRMLV